MKIETILKLQSMIRENMARAEDRAGPWKTKWRGKPALVATDAKAMIFVADDQGNEFPPVPDGLRSGVDIYSKWPEGGDRIKVGAVKAWAGVPEWSENRPCQACEGKGHAPCWACDDLGSDCGVKHFAEPRREKCEGCEGKGFYAAFPQRFGKMWGLGFNRNYLACVLETVEDGEEASIEVAEKHGLGHQMALWGRDWAVFVMGMEVTDKSKEEFEKSPELPLGAKAFWDVDLVKPERRRK